MATTARPIEIGVLGVRDTTGAVVASAKIRWYLPGTLTTTTAYTDAACSTPATAPLTANAGGQFTLYCLEPVRLIIKDSTETTTYYDDIAALNRHDSIYVTSTGWNSGAETTLETILSSLYTNLGADGKWLESAGATAIAYSTVLGQLCVPVTAFGAVGDGTTDDTTAIQAASDRVEARGGGWVYFPKGTYRINSAISIDTAGVSWCGAGRGISVIKNYGTTTNAVTVNISGASRVIFRDFSITANTTSSGAGISFTSGTYPLIQNVGVGLHRTGIATASVAGARLRDVIIESTDDNAAGVGISLGNLGRLESGTVACGTANGTGVVASGDTARVIDTTVVGGFATGITLSGAAAQAASSYVTTATTGFLASGADANVRNCDIVSCTTGVSLTGTRATAMGCTSLNNTTAYSLGVANAQAICCTNSGGTTGFTVGAFAGCKIIGCVSTNATTDLSVNASATLLAEHSNSFTTVTDSSGAGHSWLKDRPKVAKVTKVTTAGTTPAFTPTPQSCDIYVCDASAATVSITINATATTGLVDGQRFTLVVQRSGGSNNITPTFNSQYFNGTVLMAAAMDNATAVSFPLIWRAASSDWVSEAINGTFTPITATGTW